MNDSHARTERPGNIWPVKFQIFYGSMSVKVPHDLLFKCEGLFGYFYPVLLLYFGCVVVNNLSFYYSSKIF